MGRIKTTQIKRTGKKLMALQGDKFAADFEHNKKTIGTYASIQSKKLRNVTAGYISRLAKRVQPE